MNRVEALLARLDEHAGDPAAVDFLQEIAHLSADELQELGRHLVRRCGIASPKRKDDKLNAA